jgi:NAD+ kinase
VKVGLILKRGKVEAEQIARDLVPWLVARGCEAYLAEEHTDLAPGAREVPEEELGAAVELLVVLGGDGTLLHGSSLVADRGVPVLGVNLGRLGFLTPFDRADARTALAAALDGRLAIEERMRLRVRLVAPDGRVTADRKALNDAVIAQEAMARLIELLATLDGNRVTVYKADGLIVATPTGSTAYNLAAGGPVVVPSQEAMIMTPISAHTLTNRPLVVPAAAEVRVEIAGETRGALLTIDGQWAHKLEAGGWVEISRADRPLRLYRSGKSYFDILREKLNWGEREGRS